MHATTGATVHSAGEVRKQRQMHKVQASQISAMDPQTMIQLVHGLKSCSQICPILALRGSVLKISTARKVYLKVYL